MPFCYDRSACLEVELITDSNLEHAVTLAATFLVHLADTQIITGIEHKVLVLIGSTDRNTELNGLHTALVIIRAITRLSFRSYDDARLETHLQGEVRSYVEVSQQGDIQLVNGLFVIARELATLHRIVKTTRQTYQRTYLVHYICACHKAKFNAIVTNVTCQISKVETYLRNKRYGTCPVLCTY